MEMLETETIFIQILSMSSELFDMQKYCCKEGEYEKHFKPQIVEDLIKVVGQTGWRKQEDVSQYSELTYRNHRNGVIREIETNFFF